MQNTQYMELNTFEFKWFLTVTFCLMVWGMFAAWVATFWQIPLDVFSLFPQAPNLIQTLIIGAVYSLIVSFLLVIFSVFGIYNPVLGFIFLLIGLTIFLEFVVGKHAITDSRNLIWLMLLPFLVIRDLVTHLMLRFYDHKTKRINTPHPEILKSQEHIF